MRTLVGAVVMVVVVALAAALLWWLASTPVPRGRLRGEGPAVGGPRGSHLLSPGGGAGEGLSEGDREALRALLRRHQAAGPAPPRR